MKQPSSSQRLTDYLARWILALPAFTLIVVATTTTVFLALAIAPALYYLVEREVSAGIFLAALGTAGLISFPLGVIFIRFAKLLVLSERRAQQAERSLSRNNAMLRSLLETSIEMQTANNFDELLQTVLDRLHALYPAHGFAIVIHGERPSMIRYLATTGLSELDRRRIIDQNATEGDRPGQMASAPPSGAESDPWQSQAVRGQRGRTVGTLLIKGPTVDQHAQEMISLFREQLAAATENKLLQLELDKLANTDALTGLHNRAFFNRELERLIAHKAEHAGLDYCVIVADINGLKPVNDRFGHAAGDRLITRVASLLREHSRKDDVVCRIGGDEFAVLCPATSRKQGLPLLQRIREHADENTATALGAPAAVLPMSISLGMACSSECRAEDTLKLADKRMYENKQAHYAARG